MHRRHNGAAVVGPRMLTTIGLMLLLMLTHGAAASSASPHHHPHHHQHSIPSHGNEQAAIQQALNAHTCTHDSHTREHGTVSGRGVDISMPQDYHIVRADAQQGPPPLRRMHNEAAAASSLRTSPSIRIVVSSEDVMSTTRTCRTVGQETMDFIGGTILCSDASDLLTDGKINALLVHALPAAIARITKAVGIRRPVTGPLTTFKGACPYVTVPTEQLDGGGVADADLALYVTAAKTRGTTIAWSGYCGVDQYGRPILARMNVGSQYLPSNWSAIDGLTQERFIRVLQHELLHTLGFSYDYMQTFLPRSLLSTVQQLRGKQHTVVVWLGANAVAAAQTLFQCPSLGFVELEDQGGAGTALSHLERHTYYQDLMTGISGTAWRSNQLSTITLAMLNDFGHYETIAAHAEPVVWGNASGCAMVAQSCLGATDGQRVPTALQPFFCTSNTSDTIDTLASLADRVVVATSPPSDAAPANASVWRQRLLSALAMTTAGTPMHSQCTVGHLDAGSCRLYRQSAPLPGGMRYFPEDANLGGNVSLVDYCPVPTVSSTFLGHPERPRCYDPAVRAPGVWEASNNEGSTLSGLAFRGPHGACLNVLVLTAALPTDAASSSETGGDAEDPAEPSNQTAASSSRGNATTVWRWEHTTTCAELRCVWNQTVKTAAEATLFVEWRSAMNVVTEDSSSPSSEWQRCAPVMQSRDSNSSNTSSSNHSSANWVWYTPDSNACNPTSDHANTSANTTSWAFVECPDPRMVCVGELLAHATVLTGPPPPSTTTIATTTTATSTSVPTTTTTTTSTSLPTTTTTKGPTTTVASTAVMTAPPPPTTTGVPPTTAIPSPPVVAAMVQFRCSGQHWVRVLNDTTTGRRARLQIAVARMLATALNLTEGQVNVTQLVVGSLIATAAIACNSNAQRTSVESAINDGRTIATINVSGVVDLYGEVATDTPVVLSLLRLNDDNTAPTAASPQATVSAVAYCAEQSWCLGVAIVVLAVVVVLLLFAVIRRCCCHSGTTGAEDGADAADKATFRAEDGLGPQDPSPLPSKSTAGSGGGSRKRLTDIKQGSSFASGRGEGSGRRISAIASHDRQSSMTPQSTTVVGSLRGFGSDVGGTSERLSVDAASPQVRRASDRVAWGSSVESSPTTAQATPRSATDWQQCASPRVAAQGDGASLWGRRRRL